MERRTGADQHPRGRSKNDSQEPNHTGKSTLKEATDDEQIESSTAANLE